MTSLAHAWMRVCTNNYHWPKVAENIEVLGHSIGGKGVGTVQEGFALSRHGIRGYDPGKRFFFQILEAKSCILVYVKRQCRREKVTSHLILEALIIITWQRLQGEPSQRLRRCPNKIIGSTTVGHFPGHFAPPTYSPPGHFPHPDNSAFLFTCRTCVNLYKAIYRN